MTISACPHGCGGIVRTEDEWCCSCRRDLDVVEISYPGICFEWFGPSYHRMRCRKLKHHSGPHSTHNECGVQHEKRRWICTFPPDHFGKHSWED